ncbi:MAG: UDP-N-acetylmuramoyl-L-alanyl-D-glutamate--2,6-diaminopimelate ligase [Candidatus Hydrogenedentes bacterium]|nr:UDP-N-acetylmuramoyl-L-alanyl-D-glutamate--2,6-diaminopimelate ligase [Candidatus Hydrogenedentota bacterium]
MKHLKPLSLPEVCSLLGAALQTAPVPSFVDHVTEDSRRVRKGSLFVAMEGGHANGYDFLEAAAAQGASAFLGAKELPGLLYGVPYLRHPHPRQALGILAHALRGNPTQSMAVTGVTGTNGKSSTVALATAILRAAGHRTGQFGTLGYSIGGETRPAPHTTPFGETLAALCADAAEAGATHIVMETSSHALDQERVAGIQFTVGAFTNLTQDHLDYHGGMERYFAAKAKLFERLPQGTGVAVLNRGDAAWKQLRAATTARVLTYGKGGDCRAESLKLALDASAFNLATPWGEVPVRMQLIGRHNVENALCAATIAGALDVNLDRIAQALSTFETVPGRFERIDMGQPFSVVVDYAHTDDGLKNVLQTARALCDKRVITVFGCGGDRDRGKRPKMGAVAAQLSDYCIITSDNPRTEDPCRILLDVEVGVQREGKEKQQDYEVIESRAEAIARALDLARPGDIVLIAGKGHEDYQIIGTEKFHFDDREVARDLLKDKC